MSDSLRIEGLSYTIYNGGTPTNKIMIDTFKISPRKFFVFNIKSVNEATFINTHLDIYLDEEGMPEISDFLPIGDVASLTGAGGKITFKEVGWVTRGVIQGLTLKIHRAQKPIWILKTERADIDLKKGVIRMATGLLEAVPCGEKMQGKYMILDPKQRLLKVRSGDEFQGSKNRESGAQIQIALDAASSCVGQIF